MTDFDDAYRVYSGTRLGELEWCEQWTDLSSPDPRGACEVQQRGFLPIARSCVDNRHVNACVTLPGHLGMLKSQIARGSAGHQSA
jgi:hypothetical protein